MTPAARIAAAIEVIDQVAATRGPADGVLKAWGRTHRFAGSKDRKAIAEIVYGAMRTRARSTWAMGADDGRALVLGALRWGDGMAADQIAALFAGEGHGPAALNEDERARLTADQSAAPDWVQAGLPEWIAQRLAAQFGPTWLEEAKAATLSRAPVDLRVNTLRGDVDGALRLLAHEDVNPERTPLSALGLRLPPAYARDVQLLRAFTSGWVEVQDEGSQIVAALAGVRPGDTVVDYCAGGGGKTLALGAALFQKSAHPREGGDPGLFASSANAASKTWVPASAGMSGRLVSSDINPKRLTAMGERLNRAGVRAEIRQLGPEGEGMDDLTGQADLVFVDAPCSGAGTWRRHPEAAWRLTPEAVDRLAALQLTILKRAARLVNPGGRLVYVTCSLFDAENEAVAGAFAAAHPTFRPRPVADAVLTSGLTDYGQGRLTALARGGHTLQLTPYQSGTDGFFAALFERAF